MFMFNNINIYIYINKCKYLKRLFKQNEFFQLLILFNQVAPAGPCANLTKYFEI